VEIQPYFLSAAGDVPPEMQRFITNHLEKMKEIYRQIGVRVGHYGIVGKAVPQSWFDPMSAPNDAADYFIPSESNLARDAVRGLTVSGKQIRIGYVDATVMVYGNNSWDQWRKVGGFTILGTDGIIVSLALFPDGARHRLGVTAHEVGHALGLPHTDIATRRWLMKDEGLIWNDDTLDSKRFQSGDFEIIRNRQSFYVPYVPN
jgi:hypothetical protein